MKTSRAICYMWSLTQKRNLYVRSYGDFILVPPDKELWRTVDFGEIFWPISGHCSFRLNNKRYTLRPGYIWYYPPGSWHEYFPLDTFQYCWFCIGGKKASDFFSLLDIKPGLNKAGICPHGLFNQLGTYFHQPTEQHEKNALSTAFEILTRVSLSSGMSGKVESGMMEVRHIIDTRFGDPELSVGSLAESLHMHRGSFSRAFHKAFGTTVQDYIAFVRLNNAAKMLTESNSSIKSVANFCGFRSANYFGKVFLQKTGMLPNEYRKTTAGNEIPPLKDV